MIENKNKTEHQKELTQNTIIVDEIEVNNKEINKEFVKTASFFKKQLTHLKKEVDDILESIKKDLIELKHNSEKTTNEVEQIIENIDCNSKLLSNKINKIYNSLNQKINYYYKNEINYSKKLLENKIEKKYLKLIEHIKKNYSHYIYDEKREREYVMVRASIVYYLISELSFTKSDISVLLFDDESKRSNLYNTYNRAVLYLNNKDQQFSKIYEKIKKEFDKLV